MKYLASSFTAGVQIARITPLGALSLTKQRGVKRPFQKRRVPEQEVVIRRVQKKEISSTSSSSSAACTRKIAGGGAAGQ